MSTDRLGSGEGGIKDGTLISRSGVGAVVWEMGVALVGGGAGSRVIWWFCRALRASRIPNIGIQNTASVCHGPTVPQGHRVAHTPPPP